MIIHYLLVMLLFIDQYTNVSCLRVGGGRTYGGRDSLGFTLTRKLTNKPILLVEYAGTLFFK